MITIRNQSAHGTAMLSDGERLADCRPTQTGLRRATRINFHKHAPGTFSLVRKHEKESRPCGIVNRLTQSRSDESLNIQFLNCNQPVIINNLSRFFMMKVSPLVADMIAEPSKNQYGLPSTVRASLSSRYTPLQSPEFSLRLSKPSGILNRASIAESCELRQADIDPCYIRVKGQWLRSAFDGKDSKPSARFPFNGQGSNVTLEWPVCLDSHLANSRQPQPIAVKRVPDSSERNAVISCYWPEPWIARSLVSSYPPKESVEGSIHSAQRILKHMRTNISNIWAALPDFTQLLYLIKARDTFTFTLPSFASFLQGCIVKLATQSELRLQQFNLLFSWIKPIAEGFNHAGILPRAAEIKEKENETIV